MNRNVSRNNAIEQSANNAQPRTRNQLVEQARQGIRERNMRERSALLSDAFRDATR